MSVKKIIPCLDVRGGRVVTGVQFKGLVDVGDPVELAQSYALAGADELVLLDVGAALKENNYSIELIKRIKKDNPLPLTVGGGLNTLADMQKVLAAGAAKISINSAAVNEPQLIRQAAASFGSERVVVAVDMRRLADGSYKVVINGGNRETGLDAVDWAREAKRLGAGSLLLTSMDRDGVGSGYDIAGTKAVAAAVTIPVIASGGAGRLADFYDALTAGGADAVLAAGLFHSGRIQVAQLKRYLALRGLPMAFSPGQVDYGRFFAPPFLPSGAVPADAASLWGKLKKDGLGLIPVIVRDAKNREILMQAYMDKLAFSETLETGLMHFYSRSRQRLWLKGETSANFLQLRFMGVDCDNDCLLVDVIVFGPACHTGEYSCFYRSLTDLIDLPKG